MWQQIEGGEWVGHRVEDVNGVRIGEICELLVDPETGVTWIRVVMGRFTRQYTLIPWHGEVLAGGGRLRVPLTRYAVREAPRPINDDAWRTGSFRSLLYRHYGLVGLPRRRGATGAAAG